MTPIDQASVELARRAYEDNVSPRMRRLERLESFSRGDQYEGRPNFFSDSVALLDRAPCIVYDMVDQAVRSHASMVLGEGRFPEITSHPDEDSGEDSEEATAELDTESDDASASNDYEDFGLSKEDSRILDPFVKAAGKKARLRPAARRMLEASLRCGTAVAIPCVVRGRLRVEPVLARRCVPTFRDDDPESDLVQLEVRYPYVREQRDERTGQVGQIALLYRRVVDDRYDTIFRPVRANRGGVEPSQWKIQTRVEHGLGFCPAVWYRLAAEDATAGEVDGRALHRNLLDELYALDLSRSQVHRGVISTLDPILAELGVEPGFQPAPTADGPRLDPLDDPLARWRSGGSRPPWQARGRKRAPGMAYQYPVGADVKLLTLPGDCFKAGFDNVEELKAAIASALHWVPNDPEMAGARKSAMPMSGKSREWLYRKQTEYDDELRCDFGDRCLLRLVDTVLRVVRAASKKGFVQIPGVASAVAILERFETAQRTGSGDETAVVWVSPEFDLVWPPYFQSGDDDQKLIADTVRADLAAGLVDTTTAVRKLAPWYGIADPARYALALEQKKREETAALHEANALLAGAGGSDEEKDPSPEGNAPSGSGAPNGGGTPPAPAGNASVSSPTSPGAAPVAPSDGSTSIRPAVPTASPGTSSPSSGGDVATKVRAQLAPDFPPEALSWVGSAKWEGPSSVPLSQIDYSKADTWTASDDPAKVDRFVRKIAVGKMKPLVLVRRPGSSKLMVADGHHRALAYRKTGAETVPAFVATVDQKSGPWDTMHAAQKKGPGRESSGPRDDMPGKGYGLPQDASSGVQAAQPHRKPRAPVYEAGRGLLGATLR